MKLHRDCEKNKEGTEQALPREVCPGTCLKENGIQFQLRVSVGHPRHVSYFFTCLCWEQSDQSLDFSGRAVQRFIWQHILRGQGRIRKDLWKYLKKQFLPTSREWHHVSNDCT